MATESPFSGSPQVLLKPRLPTAGSGFACLFQLCLGASPSSVPLGRGWQLWRGVGVCSILGGEGWVCPPVLSGARWWDLGIVGSFSAKQLGSGLTLFPLSRSENTKGKRGSDKKGNWLNIHSMAGPGWQLAEGGRNKSKGTCLSWQTQPTSETSAHPGPANHARPCAPRAPQHTRTANVHCACSPWAALHSPHAGLSVK